MTTQTSSANISWELFHTLWTACVGTPSYDKAAWVSLETQLLENKLTKIPQPTRPQPFQPVR